MIFIIGHILAFLIAYFIGFYVVLILNDKTVEDCFITRLHSLLIGLGLTSLLYWFYVVFFDGHIHGYVCFEVLFVGILFMISPKKKSWLPKKNSTITIFQKIVCYIIFILLAIYLLFYSSHFYCGSFDAFSMWNYKAKYLAYEKPGFWFNLFDEHLSEIHKDYPLLLPCCVARLFVYANGYNDVSPRILALVFAFSVFLLLYNYLKTLKNWYWGIIAVSFLSFSEKFIIFSIWQYAEIPLIIYILISTYELTIWFLSKKNQNMPYLALLSASFACWTKNEGIVFVLLFSIAVIYYANKKVIEKNEIVKGFLFLLPGFIAMSMVKYFCKESNDLIGNALFRLGGFKNLDYYKYILLFTFYFIYRNLWLIAMPLYCSKKYTSVKYRDFRPLLLIPLFAYLIYDSMYFISPHDFYWHIRESFDRIVQHYIPTLLFFGLLLFPSEN